MVKVVYSTVYVCVQPAALYTQLDDHTHKNETWGRIHQKMSSYLYINQLLLTS